MSKSFTFVGLTQAGAVRRSFRGALSFANVRRLSDLYVARFHCDYETRREVFKIFQRRGRKVDQWLAEVPFSVEGFVAPRVIVAVYN